LRREFVIESDGPGFGTEVLARKVVSFALAGLSWISCHPGLTPGLYSFAASRIGCGAEVLLRFFSGKFC
jgi:hypothetical protein